MFRQKFGNKGAGGFSSKLEAAVHDMLLLRESAGEIKDLRCQHVVELQPGARNTRITWAIDFSFTNVKTGKTEFCEAKGYPTDVYRLKLKMFTYRPQGRLEIWGGDYRRLVLMETIEAVE